MTLFDAAFRARTEARAAEPAWLRAARESAMQSFGERGLPTTKLEDWKYTNVAAVGELGAAAGAGASVASVDAAALAPYRVEGCDLLTFVDGRYVAGLSSPPADSDGVTVRPLGEVIAGEEASALEPYLGRAAAQADAISSFVALNGALAEDGVFVQLAAGKRLARPLQLLFVASSEWASVAHLRNVVVAGRSAEATLLETYVGIGSAAYLTNAVTEVFADENALVDHHKVTLEGAAGTHVQTIQALQKRASNFRSHSFALGGALVRSDINTRMDDEGIHATLNGLFVASGRDHVDHHTIVDHKAAHCGSHELYKGVLGDRARGVFNGKIFVRQDAQKIDAVQNNKNLLLSDSATVNTKPQLEIFADDVRCTHGATIGQLDADGLFYLRSRGIGLEEARALLIYAFGGEVVESVRDEAVRAAVESLVRERLAALV